MLAKEMEDSNLVNGLESSTESSTNHVSSSVTTTTKQMSSSTLESTTNHIQSSTVTSSTTPWIGSTSTTTEPEAKTCNKTLFLATFWILVGSYIVVGTIFLAAFLLACCAEPFQKLYRLLRALWRVFYYWFDTNYRQTQRSDYEQML